MLDVDAMRLAYRVECAGETFYEQLAARIGNDEAAAPLRNAREERGHAERIRKALGLTLGRPYEPAGLTPARVATPRAAWRAAADLSAEGRHRRRVELQAIQSTGKLTIEE